MTGAPLQSLDRVDIYVDGKLAKSCENLTPDTQVKETVSVETNGTHTFSVEAVANESVSEEVSISKFIGVDIPGSFTPTLLDGADKIIVSWTPCDKGANGHFVNPDEMVYDIYTTSSGIALEVVAHDIQGTEYIIPFDTTQGEQGGIQLAVKARNSAGESKFFSTNTLIVGTPYSTPYEDHFDGTSGYYYDGEVDNYFNFAEGDSSDGDKYSFGWVIAASHDLTKELRTLKIKIDGENPYLTFDYKMNAGTNIEVMAMTPDGQIHELDVVNPAEDALKWETRCISLSKYANERYIRIFFRFVKGNGDITVMLIDNIHIIDACDNDLELTSLTLPAEKPTYGQHADISVKVTNKGVLTSDNYAVSLTADNTEIARQEGLPLEFMKSAVFNFTYEILPGSEVEIPICAQIIYTKDENADNNVLGKNLAIQTTKVSAPESLSASEANGIQLRWNAPSSFYSERITEDFESYTPWTVTNFGRWTLIDADGAKVISFEEADFPNEGAPQAFTIFNPLSIGVPDANTEAIPHSGNQYAACFAAKVMETDHNDDWLISPLLPGKAQKIGFYAKQMIPDYGSEKLQLLYSATGTEIEDFTLLQEFEINNYDDWKLFRADLPEGSKYFAFRVVTRDGHLLMLDDVIFTAGSCTEIISYNIYRSGQRIAQVGAPMTIYTDSDGKPNDRYNVTAVYATGEESDFSNTATITSSVDEIRATGETSFNVYSIDGKIILLNADNLDSLEPGLYIVNNKKMFIRKNTVK